MNKGGCVILGRFIRVRFHAAEWPKYYGTKVCGAVGLLWAGGPHLTRLFPSPRFQGATGFALPHPLWHLSSHWGARWVINIPNRRCWGNNLSVRHENTSWLLCFAPCASRKIEPKVYYYTVRVHTKKNCIKKKRHLIVNGGEIAPGTPHKQIKSVKVIWKTFLMSFFFNLFGSGTLKLQFKWRLKAHLLDRFQCADFLFTKCKNIAT